MQNSSDSGTAEAGSTVSLFIDGADTGVTVQADQTGAYTIAPTSDLTEGIHTFTISATDAAGNTSSNSVDIDVDTLIEPPVITTSGSNSIDTKLQRSEGTAEAGSTVSLFIDGADTGVTVQADETGAYTIAPTSDLTEGIHTFTISATDAAGNTSSNSVDIDVDTLIEPPVITTSGSISSKTPAIEGTAEAGSTVSLFIDGADTGVKVQADETGAYTIAPTSDLTEGIHTFTISATDAAGNTSSNSVDIDVDTTAPAQPVITTESLITNNNRPVLVGTAEPGSVVNFLVGGQDIGFSSTASTDGVFIFDFNTQDEVVPDGDYLITVTATDEAGNTSVPSAGVSITIDTAAPNAPSSVEISASITNDATTLSITGTADTGSSVELLNGSTIIGTAQTDVTSGEFTIIPSTALDEGDYNLTVKARDAAGNISSPSDLIPLSIVFDITPPAAPVITTTTALTNDNTPIIEGTAEAGSTVELFNGSDSLGTVTAADNGTFSITSSELPDEIIH